MPSRPTRWWPCVAGVLAGLTPLQASDPVLAPPAAPCPPEAPPACPAACPAPEKDPHFFLHADYLLWQFKRESVAFPLAVGAGDTALFDPKLGEDDWRSGLRLRAALMSSEGFGFEVGGFLLERSVLDQVADPAATLAPGLLARPYIDAVTGQEALAPLNAEDGTLRGSIRVNAQTTLWGAEANVVARGGGLIDTYFGGYRHLALRERLTVTDRTTVQVGGQAFFDGAPIAENDTRVRTDRFESTNDFHGAQVGVQAAVRGGAFDLTLRSAVAVGVAQQKLLVSGSTVRETNGGGIQTLPGGLLAAPSNIRSETQASFAVVPEVDLSVGVRLSNWARLSVGYTFLYFSNVVRPGEQIDPAVVFNQLPSSPVYNPAATLGAPAPVFRQTDFWAQGLNLGLTFSY